MLFSDLLFTCALLADAHEKAFEFLGGVPQEVETFPQGNPDFASRSFNGGWNEIIGKMLPELLMIH